MKEVYKALAKVQAAIHGVKRDARNPHFKNTYASLENVVSTVRGPMLDAGLIFWQAPGEIEDGAIKITTTIAHAETGEQIVSTLALPLEKKNAQGVGSAITYGCRYSLMAMLGIPATDDDGEGSVQRGPAKQVSKSAASANPQPQAQSAEPQPSYPAHQAAFLAAATEAVKTLNLGRIGAVVDFLRGEGFAIEDVRIMKREHMDAFLANHDAEEINGWTDLLREATNAAKEGAA